MDFFDNVVNKSNAIIKERLNNPFGGANRAASQDQKRQSQDGGDEAALALDSNNSSQSPSTKTRSDSASAPTSRQLTSQDSGGGEDKNSQFASIAADAEAVAQKAAKGAQKFGTFLFSMANKAGQTVSQTATKVKQAVESTSILTDLTREQQEFVREHGGSLQAGELPWSSQELDQTRAAYIQEQILSLSQDKRNFVRSPPSDCEFKFDPQVCYPIALSLLKEDPNLNKMRYELVPKLVNEDTFWCNYFYRVSMLKQMSEKGADAKKGWTSSRSSSGEGPDDEAGSIDGQAGGASEPFSPSYDTAAASAKQHQQPKDVSQRQESFSWVERDKANVPFEAQTTPTGGTIASLQGQCQAGDNDSDSRSSNVADLRSKLRELNIGSLDLGLEDERTSCARDEDSDDLREFEIVFRSGDLGVIDRETMDREMMQLQLKGPQ